MVDWVSKSGSDLFVGIRYTQRDLMARISLLGLLLHQKTVL